MIYHLSWPPSTNSIWRSFNGRNILSKDYRAWVLAASQELMLQGVELVKGPVEIEIALRSPFNRPFDLDNRIKPVLDLLVKNGVIEGDGHKIVRKLTVFEGETKGATVSVKAVDGGIGPAPF